MNDYMGGPMNELNECVFSLRLKFILIYLYIFFNSICAENTFLRGQYFRKISIFQKYMLLIFGHHFMTVHLMCH